MFGGIGIATNRNGSSAEAPTLVYRDLALDFARVGEDLPHQFFGLRNARLCAQQPKRRWLRAPLNETDLEVRQFVELPHHAHITVENPLDAGSKSNLFLEVVLARFLPASLGVRAICLVLRAPPDGLALRPREAGRGLGGVPM